MALSDLMPWTLAVTFSIGFCVGSMFGTEIQVHPNPFNFSVTSCSRFSLIVAFQLLRFPLNDADILKLFETSFLILSLLR